MPKALPLPIAAYLNKRGVTEPWRLHTSPSRRYSAAIVIPSLAEAGNLPHTLASLARNPADLLVDVAIIVVVNQRADASAAETVSNGETLRQLPLWQRQYGLTELFWIDAATAGNELPAGQGVGLARKIGMDAALSLLDYGSKEPLLICLDADTVVQSDYLAAIYRHFASTGAGGASLPYRHRRAADDAGQAAIERYELFLRIYVLGLELAGSPYAFHTVGSAMACRASAYCASGGMNRRLAGEDFYFLQQLHKTSGVASLYGTVVQPSPRASQRVPFGTGKSVGDMLADGQQRVLFYQPEVFAIVGAWLTLVAGHQGLAGEELLERGRLLSSVLADYLVSTGFAAAWDNMVKNNRSTVRLTTAFHSWFDAFRTMRLIHELSDHSYPRTTPQLAVPPLLEQAGLAVPDSVAGQLELLRTLQGAGADENTVT